MFKERWQEGEENFAAYVIMPFSCTLATGGYRMKKRIIATLLWLIIHGSALLIALFPVQEILGTIYQVKEWYPDKEAIIYLTSCYISQIIFLNVIARIHRLVKTLILASPFAWILVAVKHIFLKDASHVQQTRWARIKGVLTVLWVVFSAVSGTMYFLFNILHYQYARTLVVFVCSSAAVSFLTHAFGTNSSEEE